MADYQLLGDITQKNVLDRFKQSLLTQLNCVKVGKIKSFDSSTQTADIEIDGYPQISGVPVSFICGANFSIQVPVQSGDSCIVLFCDGDLDNWVNGDGYIPAFSQDKHGLNGAIALLGITNLLTKVENYITSGIRIKYKGSELELNDSGITIKGNVTIDGTITSSGKLTAPDVTTDVVTSLNTHVHGGVTTGSGATGTPQ